MSAYQRRSRYIRHVLLRIFHLIINYCSLFRIVVALQPCILDLHIYYLFAFFFLFLFLLGIVCSSISCVCVADYLRYICFCLFILYRLMCIFRACCESTVKYVCFPMCLLLIFLRFFSTFNGCIAYHKTHVCLFT